MWKERRLEVITLLIFLILVVSSLLLFYTSYINYTHLEMLDSQKAFAHKIIMFISALVLFLSLIIVILKRDYFFIETVDNRKDLENLLEEIKYSSDSDKVTQFKQMLKEKNHKEVFSLISSMIKELQERTQQADEANDAKTLFLSNISHELRTPINGIIGFTKMLASSKLDNEQKDFVRTISRSSEELLGVVDNILDVSQTQSGQIALEENYFNVFEAFENLAQLYTLETSKKEIEFLLWIDPSLASILVESDAEKIRQILMNLISNAIKFTKPKGKVYVSIIKEHSSKGIASIKFEVSDTGMGISQEQQVTVLNAFTQGDNSNTRAFSGVGLGLTLAHTWVTMLGGELSLNSIESKGTTVSFILNLAQKKLVQDEKIREVKAALYAPLELQNEKSHEHLTLALSSVQGITLQNFRTLVECKEAPIGSFEILYLHYDTINKEELQRILAQYSSDTPLILVTTLENRFKIRDIAPSFCQIIYKPITFSKIKNSVKISLHNKLLVSSSNSTENMFNLKALVVEDNKVNQKVILHTLKNIGIDSDTADHGKMAVEMFKQNHYDIVFMDIQMPVMNGVVATKEIIAYEELNELTHTPIIAVTTNTLKGDREAYLDAGMDEYIAKPINAHKFISVVKQFYSTEQEAKKVESKDKTILLYKQAPTEAKIMANMLSDLGYGVELAKNRIEFSDLLVQKRYDALVLDRTINDSFESMIMDKIYEQKMETLLFIDEESEIYASDLSEHIHLLYQSSDFILVEEEIEKMMEKR